MQKEKAFVVVAPSWIGDCVMAAPLISRLAMQGPVDVIAVPWVSDVFKYMPGVRNIIPVPFRHGALQLRERWRLGAQLKQAQYAQAVVLPNSWKSALSVWQARIPQRTGYRGEGRWLLLNDLRSRPSGGGFLAERYTALADVAGTPPAPPLIPSLAVSADKAEEVREQFALEKAAPLVLCPGAEYGEAKRWPTEYFAHIGSRAEAQGWQVWVLGGKKDRQEELEKRLPQARHLCGQTTLSEAIALLSLARKVLSNDSGLMHVAAALGRPVVALFGSSDPKTTPAQGRKVRMLYLGLSCSPCLQRRCPLGHLNCLRHITPDMAWQALSELE